MLYTGANYPLLYGRMGKDEKEWGKKGEGRGGEESVRRWEVVDFLKQFRTLSLFHQYCTSKSGRIFQSQGAAPEKVLSPLFFVFFLIKP